MQNRKLLSDDDLKEYYDSCLSDCRIKCPIKCSGFPVSNPPPDLPTPSLDYPSKSPHKLSTLITSAIALLSFTFFLVLCYAIYVRFYSGRTRRRSNPPPEEAHREFLDEEQGPVLDHPIWYIRTIGLQPSVISTITVCKYKRGDGLIDGTECSVCLSEFEEDETLRLLPKCSHAFHLPCIDTWLRSHTNCPMCRAPIVIETARIPLTESGVANSGQSEETLEENLQNFGESRREEGDDGGLRSSTVTEEEDELRLSDDDERRMRSDNSDEGVGDVQPMRRSVSLDSLSALKISSALAILQLESHRKVDSETELGRKDAINPENASMKVQENQGLTCLMTGSSSEKSQQSGPTAMKRSVSCSGKFLLRSSTQRSNATNRS